MSGKRAIPDLTNQRYGKWTVIGDVKNHKRHGVHVLCRCDCGTERIICASELMRGKTTMCSDCGRRKTKRDPEEVRTYMATHSRREGARHFDISYETLDRYMSRYGIKAGKTDVKQPRKAITTARHKPTPEHVERAQRNFNVNIIPRLIEGVNLRSPHKDRHWKWSGKDYLERMYRYERMVSG